MPFSNLIGNPFAKSSLSRMLKSGEIANTLLFSGPDGVGKTQFALNFAKELLDSHSRSLENHPDLHLYYPEGKSGLHPIAAMRQLIEEVHLAPFEAKRKVFILFDAERMLPASSNALLKTFEEPTLDSIIILITNHPSALLPTITSRCRQIQFYPISEDEICQYLISLGKEIHIARRIAILSQGSLSIAKALCVDELDPRREHLIEILTKQHSDYSAFLAALTKLDTLIAASDDEDDGIKELQKIDSLFDQILYWYRDLHLLAQRGEERHIFHQDHLAKLKDYTGPLPSLDKVLKLIAEMQHAIRQHVKLRVCLERFFLNV